MKFTTALSLLSLVASASACSFENVEFDNCELPDILGATGCDEAGLTALLGTDARGWATTACSEVREQIKADMLPWDRVTVRGRQFDDTFFDGGSIFNTGPMISGTTMDTDPELARIKDIKEFVNPNGGIAWPDSYHRNFDLETCDAEAVMCCWKATRLGTSPNAPQISSGNANICHHDIADSPKSARVAGGQTLFLEDSEGTSVCHGFFWDGDSKASDYKGNLLFHVAMEHGLLNNGFVRNVPSAPMCACIEQMPTVSKAGCSDVSVVETYKVVDDPVKGHYIELAKDPVVTFDNCRSQDLKTAYEAVKTTQLTKIAATNEDCDKQAEDMIREYGFAPKDPSMNWEPIAGRGNLAYPIKSNGDVVELMNQSQNKIIRRKCLECDLSHSDIYYVRVSKGDLPEGFDLQNTLLDRWVEGEHNKFNVDFELYNDYEAALKRDESKRWTYCNFHSHIGFPRDCGPTQYSPHNWNKFYSGWSKDVAFFVDMSDNVAATA
ncbi:hypothetical protein CTEN210_06761 [Chaetoceros tenuissimus]|uniref:Uncharacterized protein n=1 Tax=Chaetoceros tenuissimus TaxID=426638 RepID=A0AAD3H4Q0_9STRA|nr:hypothetical protein CTEN210_06761 [Chaetoceros tenuissimus]